MAIRDSSGTSPSFLIIAVVSVTCLLHSFARWFRSHVSHPQFSSTTVTLFNVTSTFLLPCDLYQGKFTFLLSIIWLTSVNRTWLLHLYPKTVVSWLTKEAHNVCPFWPHISTFLIYSIPSTPLLLLYHHQLHWHIANRRRAPFFKPFSIPRTKWLSILMDHERKPTMDAEEKNLSSHLSMADMSRSPPQSSSVSLFIPKACIRLSSQLRPSLFLVLLLTISPLMSTPANGARVLSAKARKLRKNSPIYYIRTPYTFNSHPFLSGLSTYSSHTSHQVINRIVRPLVASNMYVLKTKYVSNAKPIDIIKPLKGKGKKFLFNSTCRSFSVLRRNSEEMKILNSYNG